MDELEKLKSFLLLTGVYYQRLKLGVSISNLVNQLEEEILIFNYSEFISDSDLINYSGFIEKQSDIEDNYYALSYACYKFFDSCKTGNKIVDDYILKMIK